MDNYGFCFGVLEELVLWWAWRGDLVGSFGKKEVMLRIIDGLE
jgi:hypothetical protein